MRKPLVLALAAATVAVGTALAAPASADICSAADLLAATCTNVTLTVATGTLSIAVPAAAAGTSGVAPATNTLISDISLGATVVTDTRPSSTGWHTTASASQFTAVVTGPPAIPASASVFYVDQTISPVLVGATLATTPTASSTVANGGTVVTATATGPNSATFTPRLKVTVPAGQASGAYVGTVTQSVI